MNQQPSNIDTSIVSIFVTRSLGAWAIVSGLLIALSGAARWQSHAYDFLNQVPGSPYTWGLISVVGGLCIIIGSISKIFAGPYSLRNFGLWLTALCNLSFTIGFVLSAFGNPISFNIPTTYFLLCILCIFMTKSRYTP